MQSCMTRNFTGISDEMAAGQCARDTPQDEYRQQHVTIAVSVPEASRQQLTGTLQCLLGETQAAHGHSAEAVQGPPRQQLTVIASEQLPVSDSLSSNAHSTPTSGRCWGAGK